MKKTISVLLFILILYLPSFGQDSSSKGKIKGSNTINLIGKDGFGFNKTEDANRCQAIMHNGRRCWGEINKGQTHCHYHGGI